MSGFLQVAFDRIFSVEVHDVAWRWKIDLVEVESLQVTSAMIQVLYDEAEVKQPTNDAVKRWLQRLKQLLYDAEDILDGYATELLRLKLESTHPQQTQQDFERFPSKVKDVNEKLKCLQQEGVALGLNSRFGLGSVHLRHRVFSERPPTSSLVISSKVFGREEDKAKIVKWLLSDKTPSPSNTDNNFSVLPIVVMGGSGKTTLAQLVYNDEMVENSKYFDLKGWVYVSHDFNVKRLTKEIHESVTRSSEPSNSLDVLQMKLKEALNRKRFLLVLDDMWNENYVRWDA